MTVCILLLHVLFAFFQTYYVLYESFFTQKEKQSLDGK